MQVWKMTSDSLFNEMDYYDKLEKLNDNDVEWEEVLHKERLLRECLYTAELREIKLFNVRF